ncbi:MULTISPECIES: phosphatidate cytidylyltransferase [unclassified Chelatococcus]|jgi:phosphatidate cytidylyltransferase|uniref:phosphatidate cytidylyltransferase n=1 Tax=unclassified Chelatococcus TaxID=2638111 RepID=UPI001BCE1F06|nr:MULTISPECIES: phosphatidate cytidylyltransferase [unclassified Chelatococcus]CAH1673140.1 Phosphatidate cytidylyltransferase [Hyphomicrobiales bacterium]MBS7738679.1 phosphatidate cytidylyltransferase [Chelatococcus sp. HY11]MBX3543083.1 phosphatidate cytidylyltransferase [Chelatococcus sp.]MCO5076791.1 phosphatidate cytidylyltransferase [Chelatococcus sp.]CAH1674614.1 Phosphatidate cytidylyltransferase [Hyphomicrobiales bacterium]
MTKSNGTAPFERGHPARATSELTLRIASGFVLASVVLAATLWGGLPFVLIWAIAGGGVAYEWLALTEESAETRRTSRTVFGILIAASAPVLHWYGIGPALLIVAGAIAALIAMDRHDAKRGLRASGLAYAAVIALVPVAARDTSFGLLTLFWMFGVVWGTDILAYACGRLIGGPKLWPRVSPKKTWSGFIGGVAAGTIIGWMVLTTPLTGGPAPMPAAIMIALSAVAAILSQAGDLGESILKRYLGVKDSGHIIPGHGGLMDRLDSFWAVSVFLGCSLVVRSFWS